MNRNYGRKLAFLSAPIAGALLLTACAGAPNPTTTAGTNQSAQAPITAASSSTFATLFYSPTDKTLYLTDGRGLSRLRDGAWTRMAVPSAANLVAAVVNPNAPATLYVADAKAGVLRSDDGGGNWKPVNTGLPNAFELTALAIHSFERHTLYTWLKGDGIYKTEDGGVGWKRVPDQGPPDKDVRALAHSTLPGSMNTGWLYASTPTGVYLSMDCF